MDNVEEGREGGKEDRERERQRGGDGGKGREGKREKTSIFKFIVHDACYIDA